MNNFDKTRIGMNYADSETIRRIIKRREELNLSQLMLAKRLGFTSRTTVSRIENMSLLLNVKSLGKWAEALDTSVGYLLHEEDNQQQPKKQVQFGNSLQRQITTKIVELLAEMKPNDQQIMLDLAESIVRNRKKYVASKKSGSDLD